MPLVQLPQHHSSSRKDCHPKDIGLTERQANKTKQEQTQMPPELLNGTAIRSPLVRADQRVKAQHNRERRSNVRIVESREEEQRRHEGDVQSAVSRREGAMSGLLAATHSAGEDLLKNPRQGDHANDIRRSDTGDITAEDRLEDMSDQVQARWRCEFGIPRGKVVVAVPLCLWDVEDFVLKRV